MYLERITDEMRNGKIYNGNTAKFGVTIKGVDYIVKLPKDRDMSVYCEYIASRLIKDLGIPCHTVHLGMYQNIIVNVIQDFTSGTKLSLHSFKDTKQSSEDTDLSNKLHEYTYDDVLYLIDKHLKMREDNKERAKEQFWNMFICDSIIGNRDRHWGNWGYLSDGDSYRFAPLYDNGAGLFPGVNKVISSYVNPTTRYNFLKERVFVFPASLFKIRKPDRAYRSNYAEMFKDLRINKVFARQVNYFRSNFSYTDVYKIMQHIVRDIEIPLEYSRFYVEIVTLRYACIVLRFNFDEVFKVVERWIYNI